MTAFSRQLALIFTLLALFLFAWMVREVVGPVFIAALFAMLLAPLSNWLKTKLGKRSAWAPALVTVAALLLLLGPLTLVVVFTVRSLLEIKTSGLNAVLDTLIGQTIRAAQHFGGVLRPIGVDLSHEGLHESLNEAVQWALQQLAAMGGSFAASAPAMMIGAVLFVIALFFWLRDGRTFLEWLRDVFPFSHPDVDRLFADVKDAVRGVMLGQLLTGMAQSGLTMVFLFSLLVPGAFLWGVLAFVLSFLPLVGTTPVTVGASIYLFASGHMVKGIIMAVGVVVIGVADNIVRPLAATTSGRMHPLLAIVSIFGGLAAFGASGAFLGPVIAAIAVWSLEFFASSKQNQPL